MTEDRAMIEDRAMSEDRADRSRQDPSIDVLISVLDPGVGIPEYATPGDAGVDLRTTEDIDLEPGERCVVGTGIAVALPPGFAAFVHPRSGLAASLGLALVNAPGTIDAGYRGEIKVIVINLDPRTAIALHRGDRIAQMVFQPISRARFHEVATLPGSHRGQGGLGSTGVGTRESASSGDHGG